MKPSVPFLDARLVALLTVACGLVPVLARPAHGQALSVGEGSAVVVGDGAIELCCDELEIGGTLDLGSGSVSFVTGVSILPTGSLLVSNGVLRYSGLLSNQGTVTLGSGALVRVADCGVTSTVIVPTVSPVGLVLLTAFLALAALLLLHRGSATRALEAASSPRSEMSRREEP